MVGKGKGLEIRGSLLCDELLVPECIAFDSIAPMDDFVGVSTQGEHLCRSKSDRLLIPISYKRNDHLNIVTKRLASLFFELASYSIGREETMTKEY